MTTLDDIKVYNASFNPCSGGIPLRMIDSLSGHARAGKFQSLFWWNTSENYGDDKGSFATTQVPTKISRLFKFFAIIAQSHLDRVHISSLKIPAARISVFLYYLKNEVSILVLVEYL